MKIIDWILKHREWIFSGIGVAALSLILTLFFKNKSKSKHIKQNSGRDSTIMNAGGNINITNVKPNEKPPIRIASDEEIRSYDPKIKKLITISTLPKASNKLEFFLLIILILALAMIGLIMIVK